MCLNDSSSQAKIFNKIFIFTILLLVIIGSCYVRAFDVNSQCLSGEKNSKQSQSVKSLYCQNANLRDLFCPDVRLTNRPLIYRKIQDIKQANSREPAKWSDKNRCSCSRISLLEQKQEKLKLHEREASVSGVNKNGEQTKDNLLFDNLLEQERQLDKRIDLSLADNERMIRLDAGEYVRGTNKSSAVLTDYENPARFEYVNAFKLDRYEVTNLDFSLFVLATHYRTDAEQLNSSFVFEGLLSDAQKFKIKTNQNRLDYQFDVQLSWWLELADVNWYKFDDESIFKLDIKDLAKKFRNSFKSEYDEQKYLEWITQQTRPEKIEILFHPVTHVSWTDAVNYCKWAGKRLPTETEWEYSCKSDHKQDINFPWGDELNPNNTFRANLFQGIFPTKNTEEDNYKGTCPVTSLPEQTRSGFKHLIGNVWEWVQDDWIRKRRKEASKSNSIKYKVKKGGSFLCNKSYCNRYRCSARAFASYSTSTSNLGFRCASDHHE